MNNIPYHSINCLVNLGIGHWLFHNKINLLILILLMLVALLPLWLVKYPPLEDLPAHLARVHIIENYNEPSSIYPDYFKVSWEPTPYLLTDVLLLILNYFFSPLTSVKLLLSLYVILLPLSIFYLFCSANKEYDIFFAFYSFFLIYNRYFNRGFISFALSLPIFFFTFGFFLKHRDKPSLIPWIWFGLLTILLYLSHLFTYCIFLISLFIFLLIENKGIGYIPKTFCFLTPSLGLFLYCFLSLAKSEGKSYLEFRPWNPITQLHQFKGAFLSFTPKTEMAILAIPMLIVAIFFLIRLRSSGLLTCWKNGFSADIRNGKNRFLLLTIILFLLYFFIPYYILPNALFFKERVAIFTFVYLILSLDLPRSRLFKIILMMVILLSTSIFLLNTLRNHIIVERNLEDYFSGFPKVEAHKKVLALTTFSIKDEIGHGQRPYINLGAYYYLERECVGPALFDQWYMILKYRYPKKLIFPTPRREKDDSLLKIPYDVLVAYDYLVLWGNKDIVENDSEIKPICHKIFEKGKLSIFRIEYDQGPKR